MLGCCKVPNEKQCLILLVGINNPWRALGQWESALGALLAC